MFHTKRSLASHKHNKFVVKGQSLHEIIVNATLLGGFAVGLDELENLADLLLLQLHGVRSHSLGALSVSGAYPAFLAGEISSYDFVDVYLECDFEVDLILDGPRSMLAKNVTSRCWSTTLGFERKRALPGAILFQLLSKHAHVKDLQLAYEDLLEDNVIQLELGRARYYFCLSHYRRAQSHHSIYTSHFPCLLRFDLGNYYYEDDPCKDDSVLQVKLQGIMDPFFDDQPMPEMTMPYGETDRPHEPFNTPPSLASLAYGAIRFVTNTDTESDPDSEVDDDDDDDL